jgi:hypothetical protein
MEMSDSQRLQMGNPIRELGRLASVKVEVRHSPKRVGVIEPRRKVPVLLSEAGRSFEISSRGYVNNLRQRPGEVVSLTIKGVDQPEKPLPEVIQSGGELGPPFLPEPGSKVGVEASQGVGDGRWYPVVVH